MEQLIKIGYNIYYKDSGDVNFVQVFGIIYNQDTGKYVILTSSGSLVTGFSSSIIKTYLELLKR